MSSRRCRNSSGTGPRPPVSPKVTGQKRLPSAGSSLPREIGRGSAARKRSKAAGVCRASVFLFRRPRFVARLEVLAGERDVMHDPERMDQLLEALRAELGAEPEWHFFEAAVRRHPETFLFPKRQIHADTEAADAKAIDGEGTDEASSDESSDQPGDILAVWKAEFEDLQTECNELKRMISLLRAAQLVDLDLLHAALDKAFSGRKLLTQKAHATRRRKRVCV